ncbi:MAG: signal peptidase I [Candidatus Methanofastidiosia archaeon]
MSNIKKEIRETLKGILLAVLLYFLIQTTLVVAMGVDNPIVVVISGSMDHQDYPFEEWWQIKYEEYGRYGITKEEFESFQYNDGFSKGDILVIKHINRQEIKVGDVIVFQREWDNIPIVHRVIEIFYNGGKYYYLTKGDFNPMADNYYSNGSPGICEDHVVGEVEAVLPHIGKITLWFRGFFGKDA